MKNVHVLPGTQIPEIIIDGDLIETLTSLLEQAKRGEIEFLAVTWKDDKQEVDYEYFGEASPYEAVGMVEDLKMTLREDLLCGE